MTEEQRKEGILKQCKGLPSVVEKYIDFLIEKINKLVKENNRLKKQIEKMKCCANCEWFKGYGETCEGWGEPVLNLNCDCTEWKLKE